MSQVIKKLQDGGTTEKKLGSITIAGTKYDATPEVISDLSHYLAGYGQQSAPLAGLVNALTNGQDVVYDPVGNTISGMQGQWVGVDDRTAKRRDSSKGTSRWARKWDATLNTDRYRFDKALTLLAGYRPGSTSSASTDSSLKDITGERLWFDYDPDSKAYLDNGSSNLSIAKRLELMQDYLRNPREESNKIYRLGSEYNPDNLYTLYGKYGNPEAFKAKLDEIVGKAKSGTLDENDKAFLKNFNIYDDPAAAAAARAQAESDSANAAERAKWNNAGLGGLWDSLNGIAVINDDGSLSVTPGNDWLLSNLNGNVWFNDDFYKTPQGTDVRFSPYKGLTYLNGKLYAPNNPYLQAYLNAEGGFNSKMKSGNWGAANDDIQFLFTDEARKIPSLLGNEYYSEYLSGNPNLRYKNLTGLVTTEGMNPNDQIVEIYNLGDEDYNGFYRTYKPKYALLDENGKFIKDLDASAISAISNGQSRDFIAHKRVQGTGTPYDGMYYTDLFDQNGNPTNFRIFRSPKDNTYILHLPEGLRNGIFGSGRLNKNIRIPENLAKVLINNKTWSKKIFESAQNQLDFENIISEMIQRKGIRFGLENSLRKLGFNDSEIAAFKEALQGSMQNRRQSYLVDDIDLSVPSQKNGGILKHQFGGFAGGSTSAIGVTEQKVASKANNPQNAKVIGDGKGTENWTSADTADIVATIADLTSLGLALSPDPYTDVASVATGAAGSTARLYADSQRGTKGKGLNYLISLGMDAVGLVPLIGGPAKAGSTLNKFRKTLPVVLKGLALVGAPIEAVHAAKNIANGNFTIRDLNMLVDALGGLEAVRRSGFKSGTKKTKGFEDITVKGREAQSIDLTGKDIKFEKAELEAIANKNTPEEATKAWNELLLKKVQNATGNDSINLEQAKALTGLDSWNALPKDISAGVTVQGRKWTQNTGLTEGVTLKSDQIKAIAEADPSKQEGMLKKAIADAVRTKSGNTSLTDEQALALVDMQQFTKQVKDWKLFNPKSWFAKGESKFNFNPKEAEGAEEVIASSGNRFKDWWNGVGEFKTGPFGIGGKKVSRTGYRAADAWGTGRKHGEISDKAFTIKYNGKNYTISGKDAEIIAGNPSERISILKKYTNNDEAVANDLLRTLMSKYNKAFNPELDNVSGSPISDYYRRLLFTETPSEVKFGNFRWHPTAKLYQYKKPMSVGYGLLPYGKHLILAPLTDNELEPLPGSVMRPLYEEKGGKVEKHLAPFKPLGTTPSFKTDFNTPDPTKNWSFVDGGSYGFDFGTGKTYKKVAGMWLPNESNNPTKVTTESTDVTKPEQNNNTAQDKGDNTTGPGTEGRYYETPFNFDPTVPLNWARALYSMHQSNKQLKNFEKLPTLQMQYPLTNAPRYINSGSGNAYRTSAQKLRLHKARTSDATMDWLTRQQELQKALELERQGNLADSQEYGQYKAVLDDYNNKVALRNTDIANKNRELRYNRLAQGVQMKNANIAEKSKFFDQAAYATQDWITKQLQIRDSLKAQEAYNNELGELSKWYDSEVAKLNTEFPTTESKQSDSYRQRATQLGTMMMLRKNGLGLVGQRAALKYPFQYYAKGGTVSRTSSSDKHAKVTYSRDPYPDLLLQNSKGVDKYVQKLSDNTIKLILQAKPLYVSK